MKRKLIVERLALCICTLLLYFFCVKTAWAQSERNFPKITIPDSVSNNDKINYLAIHYWDNFDFQDTTFLVYKAVINKALASYIQVLAIIDSETADASLHFFLEKLQKSQPVFSYFLPGLKSYLYDPNSPFRNDDYYLTVLNTVLNSPHSDWTDKERAKREKQSVLKNSVGTKAADVVFTMESGESDCIYNSSAPYTLLFFYNPGCNACEEAFRFLKQSEVINAALIRKELTLIAIYPDEDLSAWRNYISKIPTSWINGYDKNMRILNQELYDLRAIPSLYLLDADKSVLLKDSSAYMVETFLAGGNL
uniref:DUF5106 domain-containing protein n=1 Tax=uncultured Draconibacterium sp. TaxID=1573823 RepID=UPI003217A92D